MGFLDNILKKVVLEAATIVKKVKISDAVYHLTLQSDSIQKTDFMAGSFLRLGIGIDDDTIAFKDKVRSYSVWDINKTTGTLDIAIATESNGIGAQWVANCQVGDPVYFKWKKGNFLVDTSADSYLMIGDVCALSHLYILNRHLQQNKQVESLIYSQNKTHFFEDIDGSNPFQYYTLAPNSISEIITLINNSVPKMKGNKMVYIAGDSRVCIALHAYFKNELHWNTAQIKTKPFWNPTKKGLE